MTDVIYPPRNLPGDAEAWGRAIEGVISDTRRTVTQVQQTLGNDGRSTSGQLAVISRQLEAIMDNQQDLLGRESYAVFWENAPIIISSNVSDVSLSQLSISFQLRERRVVSIRTTVDVSATRGSGAASAGCGIWHSIDGVVLTVNQTSSGFARGVVVNEPMFSQTVATTLISLDPGSYLMTPKYSTYVTPNGNIGLQAGSTVVDVLQRAT